MLVCSFICILKNLGRQANIFFWSRQEFSLCYRKLKLKYYQLNLAFPVSLSIQEGEMRQYNVLLIDYVGLEILKFAPVKKIFDQGDILSGRQGISGAVQIH